jgi:hypothetical protein
MSQASYFFGLPINGPVDGPEIPADDFFEPCGPDCSCASGNDEDSDFDTDDVVSLGGFDIFAALAGALEEANAAEEAMAIQASREEAVASLSRVLQNVSSATNILAKLIAETVSEAA